MFVTTGDSRHSLAFAALRALFYTGKACVGKEDHLELA